MATLVDSSVVIAAERGDLNLAALLERDPQEEFALSAIGASELLHGLHRARTEAQRLRREAFLNFALDLMPVLPFDLEVARVHAALWARLARAGSQVGERDLMIAATALARGYRVATLDIRRFPRIPGLKVLRI
ncbi:MAG TPA: PIN domain-containing protein [Candidatus Binataceae bacterium]|nr:PIN domain-containing protein [Candidatus Binataceae bacterium]